MRRAPIWTALRDLQTVESNKCPPRAGGPNGSARSALPLGGATHQLDRRGSPFGAHRLVDLPRVVGREAELTDHGVVLGVGAQQAGRGHVVVELDADRRRRPMLVEHLVPNEL